MIARQLLLEGIMPLFPDDTADKALLRMTDYNVSHLPIVDGDRYCGLISDTDILALESVTIPVKNVPLSTNRPFVRETYHLFEVLDVMSKLALTLLPVLDEKDRYRGAIIENSLITSLANITAVNNPGGIIVLEMSEKNYLLTEIAQIVESNDAKILSLYLTSDPDSTKLEVTLKLNRIDISSVIQTFTRYGYTIQASYPEDTYNDGLQDRFDALMNYLNI
ncbi:MAG: CBS domain-containing protein [Syntrophothermus sp.]